MNALVRLVRSRAGARWRDEHGAAAVEFALVLPVLILILFGIVEFAMAWNARQTLTDAAREGARVAAVHNGMLPVAVLRDSVISIVRNAAGRAGLDLTKLTVNPTGIGATGGTARVDVAYIYTPIMGLVLNTPITMNTSSVMRNE